MNELTDHITKRLKEKKACSIFENSLEKIWPRCFAAAEKRQRAIEEFAKARGWSVTFRDPGLQVTFRKLDA